MNFEKFVQLKNKEIKVPCISIHATGGFGFLQDFWTQFPTKEVSVETGIGRTERIRTRSYLKFVSVYWDKEKRGIGFVFHENEVPESHKLSSVGSYFILNLSKFFTKYKLNPSELAGRYPVHDIDYFGDKMFYILLNEKVQ